MIFIQSDFFLSRCLAFMGKKMGVVEDSFKLPTKSITDHWNSLHRTSALFFSSLLPKTYGSTLGVLHFLFFATEAICSMEFWPVVNRTLAKAVLGTLGPSRLQSSLVNCEKCTHFWLIYALLWVWRETTSSPPHPPAENQNPVELLQCCGAGALNCFLGQITLFLVVKRHFRGGGETRNIERNSKRKSVLGWFTARI